MNLLCLSDFNQGDVTAKAGDVRWFPPTVAAWLCDSFPSCWQVAPLIEVPIIEQVAIDAPPVDKMIRKAKRKGA